MFAALCFLFWNLILHAQSCTVGLTQLRYPKSLSVMRCTPAGSESADPCRGFVEGKDAYCQKDAGGEFVCCGSTALLLEILSPNFTSPNRRLQEPSLLERPSPPPFLRVFSNGIDPSFLFSSNSRHSDFKSNYGNRRQFFDTIRYPAAIAVSPRPTLTNAHYLESNQIVEIQPVFEEGPTVTLLATGRLDSFSSRATVTFVEDGNCKIVVNTGLPSQATEIRAVLSSKGLADTVFDYTVGTSALPQFIGNLNLFNAKRFQIGSFDVQGDTVSKATVPIDLCSQKSQLIATPGSASDGTTVILRNVRGMGTVAITGALFLEDDSLNRTDALFTSNRDQLIASRRAVICQADWIVPGHAGPIPVSEQAKINAGC